MLVQNFLTSSASSKLFSALLIKRGKVTEDDPGPARQSATSAASSAMKSAATADPFDVLPPMRACFFFSVSDSVFFYPFVPRKVLVVSFILRTHEQHKKYSIPTMKYKREKRTRINRTEDEKFRTFRPAIVSCKKNCLERGKKSK